LRILAVCLLAMAVGACSGGGKTTKANKANKSKLGDSASVAVAPNSPTPTSPAASTAPVPLIAGQAVSGGTPPLPQLPGGKKPNVLFVLTDDMRFDDLQYLPQIKSLIGDQGMTFDNEFDNVTLCCPARTSIIRGQYSHNTGVLTNDKENGGFETAYAQKDEDATIGTAMHSAG